MSSAIGAVVLALSAKHAHNWPAISLSIVKNIPAENYIVAVPARDLPSLLSMTPSSFKLLSEDEILPGLHEKIRTRLGPSLQHRSGWYFQQFLKLELIRRYSAHPNILIWDSDTMPLKRLQFFGSNSRAKIYSSSENHQAYFGQVYRLTGLNKQVNFSFIAQHLVLKGRWIQEFFQFISKELNNPSQWFEPVLDSVDFAEKSGLSEYELLGTWISAHYPDEYFVSKIKWSRRGSTTIGSARLASNPIVKFFLSQKYDFIAFENWGNPPKRLARWSAKWAKKKSPGSQISPTAGA